MGYYTTISAVDTKNGRVIAELFDRKIFGYVDDDQLYEAIGFMCMECEIPLDVRNINKTHIYLSIPCAFRSIKDIKTFVKLLEKNKAIEFDYTKEITDFVYKIEKYKIDNNILDTNIQFDIDCS